MAATRSFDSSTVVDGNSYYVPNGMAKHRLIERDLTITIVDFKKHETMIPLFERLAGCVRVPRLYGIANYGKPTFSNGDKSVDIDPSKVEDRRYALHDDQIKCIEAIDQTFFNPQKPFGGTLNLACGKGKTHIGIHKIATTGKRTLVVCHSGISVRQWISSIQKSLPRLIVEQYRGGELPANADVVVATIHPLILQHIVPAPLIANSVDEEFKKWLATFGFVIYDEIHIFGAPKFSRIFDIVRAKYQLGLSATPERSDGMERAFELKVGPILNATKDLHIVPHKFQVFVYPIDPLLSQVVHTTEMRGMHYSNKVTSVTCVERRGVYLVDLIRKHLSSVPDDNIIVFCNYIQEVRFLLPILSGAFASEVIGTVAGDMEPETVDYFAENARIIVCTYKKGGTGFSPIRFRTAVIYSPTRAYIEQAVGRVQRWREDSEEKWNEKPRFIYDFVDRMTVAGEQYYSASQINGTVIRSRRQVYIEAGYKVYKPKDSKSIVESSRETSAMLESIGL